MKDLRVQHTRQVRRAKKVGLKTSNLLDKTIDNIQNEEKLEETIFAMHNKKKQRCNNKVAMSNIHLKEIRQKQLTIMEVSVKLMKYKYTCKLQIGSHSRGRCNRS